MTATETPRITREDIETKLRQLKGDADDVVEQNKTTGLVAAVVAGLAVLALAYLLGRRKGKKKSAFVEIRRL